MKTIVLLILSAVSALPATLAISQADLAGTPGQTVSWIFEATADPGLYITFVGSFLLFETNPSIGVYSDSIGALGGPVNFALQPASGSWSDVLGSFSIDPLAAVGAKNEATLRVLFETYSGDPLTCGACFVSSGWEDITVSVSVAHAPEPGSMLLVAAAAVLIGLRKNSTLRIWKSSGE